MASLPLTGSPALLEPEIAAAERATGQAYAPSVPWLRRVFSFPVVLAFTLVVLAVFTAQGRLSDPDLWWHLKVGEIIWNTHTLPAADLLSYTTNQHSWIAHEWLSEVTIYGAYRFGGYTGLMLWLCFFSALLLVLQYGLCSAYSGNSKVALVGAMTTWLFATVGFTVRPHLLGYVFLVFELLVVQLGRTRSPRWLFLLPPLFTVWINCHGSFFMGLVVLAVIVADALFPVQWNWLKATPWTREARRRLLVAAGLSIAALFVNPIGFRLVWYPLDVMFNQPANLGAIEEWQPLGFNDVRAMCLLAVVALIVGGVLRKRIELRTMEALLVALGFAMAARHSRLLFLFGVLAAPVLTRLLAGAWDRYDQARERWLPNAVVLAAALAISVAAFPNARSLEQQVQEQNPVAAVRFIRSAGLSGRMLNDYAYGGYLIWALPEQKVFIDGRTDIYEWTGVLQEFGSWALLRTDPSALLRKYRIDFCLLAAGSPMSFVLPHLPDWKQVYSDRQSVVFARQPAPAVGK